MSPVTRRQLDGAPAPLHTPSMADLLTASTLLDALTARLRDRRPDWSANPHSYLADTLCLLSDGDGAMVSVAADKRTGRAVSVEVSPSGGVRRTTYKALADLPALCAKIEERLAEGFAGRVAARKALEEREEREARVAARKAEREAEYPRAFAAGCRHEWNTTVLQVPGRLAAIALAAVEAHLRQEAAQKEAAPPPEGEGAARGAEGAGC